MSEGVFREEVTVLLKRRVNIIAGVAVIFTLIIPAWIFIFQESLAVTRAKYRQMTGLERLEYNNNNLDDADELLTDHLRVALPKNYKEEDISTYVEPVSQIITVFVPKVTEAFIYDNPIVGCDKGIQAMDAGPSDLGLRIDIQTDDLYEPELLFENDHLYISFRNPRELYDRIVVVDPGHGGEDTGMVVQGCNESDLNLSIAKYVQQMFEDKGIRVYMTRSEDITTGLDQRVSLANKLKADAFISIHCNAEKDDNNVMKGTQVLYNAEDTSGAGLRLSELCMDGVTQHFGSVRLLCSKGNDIYIVRKSKVPVSLVEVGFMTNKEELNKLISPEGQRNAAAGIIDGVMKAYERGIIHDE